MSERNRESSFLRRTLRQLRSPLHRVFEPISAIIRRVELSEDEADSVAEAVMILFVMLMRAAMGLHGATLAGSGALSSKVLSGRAHASNTASRRA